MFHFYDGYHLAGMHMLWWVFWILFISIMFGAYEPIRRQRGGKGMPENLDAAKQSIPGKPAPHAGHNMGKQA